MTHRARPRAPGEHALPTAHPIPLPVSLSLPPRALPQSPSKHPTTRKSFLESSNPGATLQAKPFLFLLEPRGGTEDAFFVDSGKSIHRLPRAAGWEVRPVRQPCGVFTGWPLCKNTDIRQGSDLPKQEQPRPENVPAGPPPSRPLGPALGFLLAGVSAAFVSACSMEILLCFAVGRASATAKTEVLSHETAGLVKNIQKRELKQVFPS